MRTTATVLAGLLGLLAATGSGRADEKLTPEERERLAKEARELAQRAGQLSRDGRLVEATELAAKVLDKARLVYPKSDFPDGHPDLALRISILAALLQARGEYAKAEPL